MRTIQVLFLVAALSLLSGCARHLYWLQITPEKQVLEGYDEDQDLRNRLSKLAKGPKVEGKRCSWFIMTPSIEEQTRKLAYAEAMVKAGSPYNALIDVMQTSTSYAPFTYCVSLKGTAVKQETYYATSTVEVSEKRKGKVR